MHKRKIQLIAGSTYTVSLPKEWVVKNGLKERNEVSIFEKNNNLVISKGAETETMKKKEIDVDNYNNIKDVLFTLYYHGIETIVFYSKKEISKEVKSKIRKTLQHMSGSEIVYEDKKRLTIKILLDRSKIKLNQLMYRSFLIIDLSLANLLTERDFSELIVNEEEIDRLYNLMSSLLSLSIVDAKILNTSGIKEISLVPQYFLISKKIENLADDIYRIIKEINKGAKIGAESLDRIKFIKKELNRISSFFLKPEENFKRYSTEEIKDLELPNHKGDIIQMHINSILRNLVDIEQNIMKISLYSSLF